MVVLEINAGEKTLEIPFLDVTDPGKALIYESTDPDRMKEIKYQALDTLGISYKEGEDPVDAWGRHIHEINGLEFTKPYNSNIVRAIRMHLNVYKFFFYLA